MKTWETAARNAVVSGGLASVGSALMLALRGRLDNGRAAGAVNAPSHWIWGDEALRHDDVRPRYTLVGFAVHHAASFFWAVIYEKLTPADPRLAGGAVMRNALAVSVAAACVDLQVAPRRLTPGFERRLSGRSLYWVYGAFALGMAAGTFWLAGQSKRRTVRLQQACALRATHSGLLQQGARGRSGAAH